ncbi:Ephrin type-A receptor 4 [Ceratobasidium sp. AG-Ba]|nr:Ephrin type-A receptor 4 [Ceratobasidium sp. AG-Ba]
MCKEVSEGLAHLHAYDVIHADLKGANVLISSLGIPKLTDFGNTTLSQYTVQFTATTSALPISLRWTAPELVKGGKSFTKEADVHALSMVFYEIVAGEVLFARTIPEYAVYSLLMKGKTPEVPPAFGSMEEIQADMLQRVMAECWKSDLAERSSANDIQLQFEQLSQAETQGSEDQVPDTHVG